MLVTPLPWNKDVKKSKKGSQLDIYTDRAKLYTKATGKDPVIGVWLEQDDLGKPFAFAFFGHGPDITKLGTYRVRLDVKDRPWLVLHHEIEAHWLQRCDTKEGLVDIEAEINDFWKWIFAEAHEERREDDAIESQNSKA